MVILKVLRARPALFFRLSGIRLENFWNQAKRHMRKFNGVPKAHFGLFLKDCEWRFNNSDPADQLSQLRQWVRGNMG